MMKIIKDRDDPFFSKRAKLLGNAITVICDDMKYYYEFNILLDTASIKYSSPLYIEEATKFYHSSNKYIYKYKSVDDSFFMEFDKVFTFKLPISALQPSCFFIVKDRLEEIEEIMDIDKICLPVAIINDEYVLLDGHTRCFAALNNYHKLIDVYIDSYKPEILDFIYIAKEQNIRSIKQMNPLSHKEFIEIWEGFLEDYHKNN